MKLSDRIRKQLAATDGLPTAWSREDVKGLLEELDVSKAEWQANLDALDRMVSDRDEYQRESSRVRAEALAASEARSAALAAELQADLDSNADPDCQCDRCVRIRALLAAAPAEAAAELAALRDCFEHHAPLCDRVNCDEKATKRARMPDGMVVGVFCDEHAPEGSTDLPWAGVVRAKGTR